MVSTSSSRMPGSVSLTTTTASPAVVFLHENPSLFVVVATQVRAPGQGVAVLQTFVYWQRKPEKPVWQAQENEPLLFVQVPPNRQGSGSKRGQGVMLTPRYSISFTNPLHTRSHLCHNAVL